MKRLAQKILKNLKDETGDIPEDINQDIPDYKQIENHKEAKATMKVWLINIPLTKFIEMFKMQICNGKKQHRDISCNAMSNKQNWYILTHQAANMTLSRYT